MDNKKKILITVISIIVIILIAGLIYFFATRNNIEENNNQRLAKLYDTLNNKNQYTFSLILDDNNKKYYAKQNNVAYINSIYLGNESKFIIKNGNSYLLRDEDKAYFTYQNNETDLNMVINYIEGIKNTTFEIGKEKIDNKNYNYEEYNAITGFLMKKDGEMTNEEIKTRFYFNDDELKYIKTIVGNYQELLKVEISDDVDSNLFNIPSDYQEK